MNKKSLESHQARRACANYQRGNTRDQRISLNLYHIIGEFSKKVKDIADAFHNQKMKTKINLDVSENVFKVSTIMSDIYLEKNKVSIIINKNQ
jgi:hypothetical protein